MRTPKHVAVQASVEVKAESDGSGSAPSAEVDGGLLRVAT